MRNRPLHATLRAFTEEAALQLAHDAAEGDVPFDLVEEGGLYCYKPLVAEFIRSRLGVLGRTSSYPSAAQQLEALTAVGTYIRAQGERRVPDTPRDRADAALRLFLSAVFEGVSEFEFSGERFERAYAVLEGSLYQDRTAFVVAAALQGLELESDEVALGEGLSLVHGGALDDLPDDAWLGAGEEDEVFVILRADGGQGDRPPVTEARKRFRRLLSALRLFDEGTYALGPAMWVRVDEVAWRMVALGGTGRARNDTYVSAEQEDELRAFVSLVSRRSTRAGSVAWALARYELGCERPSPLEGLTDYLLVLRALLDPEGAGMLARRLAAICALPEDRPGVVDRTERAVALEKAVITGVATHEPNADALIAELAGHARALLRDVLCGHLDADLVGVANGIFEAEAPPRREEPRPTPYDDGQYRGTAVLG